MMQKKRGGMVEASSDDLILYQMMKDLRNLNKKVDMLEKQLENSSDDQQ